MLNLKSGSVLLMAVVFTITMLAGVFFSLWQTPREVMTRLQSGIAQAAGGWNECFHRRDLDLRRGGIRRANPDVLPTAIAYDLKNGPLRLKGPTWPAYWSLSAYQQNSDNYYVINDRSLPEEDFDLVFSREPIEVADNVKNVVSPTQKGIIVVRRLVPPGQDLSELHANQDSMYCIHAASISRDATTVDLQ